MIFDTDFVLKITLLASLLFRLFRFWSVIDLKFFRERKKLSWDYLIGELFKFV